MNVRTVPPGRPNSERAPLVTKLVERLRSRGWRLTAQRRVIAEALNGTHTHLTAEQVLTLARRALPEISLATVYNTLNELVAIGEVTVLRLRDGAKHYDPNTTPHDHLVCWNCGKVVDVTTQRRPSLSDHERHDFENHTVAVTYEGRCPECQRKADVGQSLQQTR